MTSGQQVLRNFKPKIQATKPKDTAKMVADGVVVRRCACIPAQPSHASQAALRPLEWATAAQGACPYHSRVLRAVAALAHIMRLHGCCRELSRSDS